MQFNFIEEIMKLSDSKNYSPISSNDISPARSYENIGPFNMPFWLQVLAIVGVAIVIVAVIFMFTKISKKDKK